MDYSQSEIESMRNDALRRTREMHGRANNGKNNVQADIPLSSYCVPSEVEESCQNENNQSKSNTQSGDPLSGLLSGLFSKGKIDNDRLIIIILIVILAKEGADLKLLIALGYIIM